MFLIVRTDRGQTVLLPLKEKGKAPSMLISLSHMGYKPINWTLDQQEVCVDV